MWYVGAVDARSTESLLDARIGDWTLTRVIDAGGMASVFEARNPETGAVVAIKVLRRELRDEADPAQRLMQEGRVIRDIQHEHVVKVIDYGVTEELLAYLVMERLHGSSLADLLDEAERLRPSRVVFIATQICQGLAAAHARGVFHRDIKPGNIYLAEGQRHRDFVKLLDFGIAKLRAEDPARIAATETGMTLGTPEYMSPEQATAGVIDARSDLYQVGLVMYEMLTGAPAFYGKNPVQVMRAHLSRPPKPICDRFPEVPKALEEVVGRCLAKDPELRFPDADALAEALEGLHIHDTDGQGLRTIVQAGPGDTSPTTVGDLRLPTLGSVGDMERYARNLEDGLARIWPDGDLPDELVGIRKAIAELHESRATLQTELHDAAAEEAGMTRDLEARQQPLERAIATLQTDLTEAERRFDAHHRRVADLDTGLAALDAEYAEVYAQIETHQLTLYESKDDAQPEAPAQKASLFGGIVDFSDLFREDIAASMDTLERLYRRRSREAQQLSEMRQKSADMMRQMADIRIQIAELRKSLLSMEVERGTLLAEKRSGVARLRNRYRTLERALEHRHLQLGLAFRKAVSRLIARGSV
jgi:serine/threonine protein kinase